MGCTPSSQSALRIDNESRLLLEIDRLRTGHQSQEQEISRLLQENEKLRQLNGQFEVTDTYNKDEDHDLLVKELERLKLDKEKMDNEMNKLRQNNEELNIKLQQNPQVAQVKRIHWFTCSTYSTKKVVSVVEA